MNIATATRQKTTSLADRTAFAQITVAPTLCATMAEGLGRERGSSVKSVCLFAVSVVTLGWAVDSLLPVFQKASQYLIGWSSGSASAHHFAEPLVKAVVLLLAFGAMVAFMIFNAHRNARLFVVASVVPDPHPGLILQLKPQLVCFTTERV